MKMQRISFDMDSEEHKYLKMCCAKLGVSLKQFITEATIKQVDLWEDKWMLEQWEADGTLEEIERDSKDPNRIVFEMKNDGDQIIFVEKKYSDLDTEASGS